MTSNWSDKATFHLGINMPGAVSAGAYTAGVLDFLTEAIEQWYIAKQAPNPTVPMHDVIIDVFSGASAGGMCAAISSVMMQGAFDHIHDPIPTPTAPTSNRFYESWVNRIDIQPLLGTDDLKPNVPVPSLLDCTIIDQIADYAISPVPAAAVVRRPYISDSLTLFLTLTNVRGVPFNVTANASGSAEQQIAYYADRLQFETVFGDAKPQSPFAKPLPIGSTGGQWDLLKVAAKATGAFPIFLAPRIINRQAGDYYDSPWNPVDGGTPAHVKPAWTLSETDTFTTLNVDGGVTDNDPFELAHGFLATQNPEAKRDPETGQLHNPSKPEEANCAVLTIAPFPAQASFDPNYFDHPTSLLGMLSKLVDVLISQSRFQGESLAQSVGPNTYSRFVMAPSEKDQPIALQCSLLGAFGGFFERGFRAHDYQLGRRNCQRFLTTYFKVSVKNPIILAGLAKLSAADAANVTTAFDPTNSGFMPIIPVVGSALPEIPAPARASIASDKVDHIVELIVQRLKAVVNPMVDDALGHGLGDFAVRAAVDTLINTWGKHKLNEILRKQLGDAIQP